MPAFNCLVWYFHKSYDESKEQRPTLIRSQIRYKNIMIYTIDFHSCISIGKCFLSNDWKKMQEQCIKPYFTPTLVVSFRRMLSALQSAVDISHLVSLTPSLSPFSELRLRLCTLYFNLAPKFSSEQNVGMFGANCRWFVFVVLCLSSDHCRVMASQAWLRLFSSFQLIVVLFFWCQW